MEATQVHRLGEKGGASEEVTHSVTQTRDTPTRKVRQVGKDGRAESGAHRCYGPMGASAANLSSK